MTREKGYVINFLRRLSTISFSIDVENVRSLLRMSDKYDIEYLMNEIKVRFPFMMIS
jgi:hypothetical protein